MLLILPPIEAPNLCVFRVRFISAHHVVVTAKKLEYTFSEEMRVDEYEVNWGKPLDFEHIQC